MCCYAHGLNINRGLKRNKTIIIIGGGFSSLAASCYLRKAGYNVTLLEKNKTVGGRARQLKKAGFTFDIGPTFYWMPDVFERFFADFGKKVDDFYKLEKLNPAYQVYFKDGSDIKIDDNFDSIKKVFNQIEPGSDKELERFINQAGDNYDLAIQDLVYKPGESILEITTPKTAKKIGLFFKSISDQVKHVVKNENLKQILEFPVLFLGAKPSTTPAFYNFMNYADLKLGTWHPQGGMYRVIQAMKELALELGVKIELDCPVEEIMADGKTVKGVRAAGKEYAADIVLSGADYWHTEKLLPKELRQYKEKYWEKQTFAPSALLFYVGFKKKLKNVSHHTLFFDADFKLHAEEIYDTKKWPSDPLFYASFPSMTDESAAPEGKEAGIFLMPIATNLEDNEETRQKYFDIIMTRLEKMTDQSIREEILFQDSYSINDFKKDYNAYGGNAYGLANTLLQTHILRPKLKSKKVKNLYFTGQLTVPGPGVPPSLISGKVVSDLILKHEN